jgi:hypothetical protein
MGVLAEQEIVVPAERHYAVIEVAEMWNLNPDKVRGPDSVMSQSQVLVDLKSHNVVYPTVWYS